MCDPAPERSLPRKLLIHVQLDEVARQTGESDDIGLRDCTPARYGTAVENEVFKIEAQEAPFLDFA